MPPLHSSFPHTFHFGLVTSDVTRPKSNSDICDHTQIFYHPLLVQEMQQSRQDIQ
jgi:hypothetical protein